MRKSYDEYLHDFKIDITSLSYSSQFIHDLKPYYDDFKIDLAPLLLRDYTEEVIQDKLNALVLKQYTIRFHNIGENAYQRFYRYGGHYEWLKTLHVLIANLYGIMKKVKNGPLATNISNRTMAISLGYITEKESNPELIAKALRKVTDSLAILKSMDLITVRQNYRPGRRGSGHTIRLNWLKVLDLFSNHDYNADGSIRIRKTIRYRIISFVKKTSKKFSNSFRKLLQKQELYYLRDVVTYNVQRFQEDKFLIFRILASDQILKPLLITKHDITLDNIVPVMNEDGSHLILKVKNEHVYKELKNQNYVANVFKERYKISLALVPAY